MLRVKLMTVFVIAAAVWPSGAYASTDPPSPVAPTGVPDAEASSPQDLRSPDARDAALAAEASSLQDLRSPDARDAALAAEASSVQDLRSPDARDAAREAAVTHVESARAAPSRSAPSVSGGFEWGDAGIGAAVMLALVGVASGTLLVVGRSRHRTPTT